MQSRPRGTPPGGRQAQRLAQRIQALEEQLQDEKQDANDNLRAAQDKAKRLATALQHMKLQLRHSEQRVRSKEEEAESLAEKLRAVVEAERASRARHREAFARFYRRAPEPQRTRDGQVLELVAAYEARHGAMSDELQGLRRQVRDLTDSVREKEAALRRVGLAAAPSVPAVTAAATAAGHGDASSVHRVLQQLTDRYREQVMQRDGLKGWSGGRAVTGGGSGGEGLVFPRWPSGQCHACLWMRSREAWSWRGSGRRRNCSRSSTCRRS